ncbi:glycosyltransferase family 4 protein [Photorhabdus heterorhabditis]|uniref:Glycosyltransferase family 4 protein n=1 Tax=Photorhabdus heterorhabditis TaxID=880156 RepID=A0A5B0X8J1_9GAMM|nr:glycosyltransferase family 1 protein [Photorhabdus heterorhabditis]KAA1194767.1 glycosyltransferase family 4 protein [Photorhabdus heterorhabditis]
MIIIDGIIFTLQKFGGISVYTNELITRMLKDNLPCTILTYGNENPHFKPEIKKISKLQRIRLSLKLERYLPVPIPLKPSKNIKIFHSSYYRLPDNKFDGYIITTVHDFIYEKYKKGLPRIIHSWQKKKAVKNSDAIICISENTKKDLIKFYPWVDKKKLHVVYNGVSDDFYPINKKEEEYKTEKKILFVGQRDGYKNFNILVDALSASSEYSLIIVGSKLKNKEKIYLDNTIKNRYIQYSNVSNNELNVLYNSAFALIYPSLYEGFGIPVIEAMKAGCPVIAANTSSIPEISRGAAILLNNINVHSILDALQKLKSPKFRDNIIRMGLNNSSLFSWDYTWSHTKKIYDELLRES